jgi:hypothetical protein
MIAGAGSTVRSWRLRKHSGPRWYYALSCHRAFAHSFSLSDLNVHGLLFIGIAPVGVFGVLGARMHGTASLVYVGNGRNSVPRAVARPDVEHHAARAGSVFAQATEGSSLGAGVALRAKRLLPFAESSLTNLFVHLL